MTGVRAATRRVRKLATLFTVLLATQADAAAVDYADASDADLQALSASWDELSGDQRRALLTEIHQRMIAAGKKPVLRIRTERRFGYRVPQPDGSVVTIERRQEIVRYRSVDPSQPFGVGFEKRTRQLPQPTAVSDLIAADAPRPGSAAARRVGDADADTGAQQPVPPASGIPIYQLPIRQVQANERPR